MAKILEFLKELVEGTTWNFFGYLLGFNLLILCATDRSWTVLFILTLLDISAMLEPHVRKQEQMSRKILSDEKLQTKRFKRPM